MSEKNFLKNIGLKFVSEVIKHETKRESLQWPPVCLGLIYQPKRPKKMRKETRNEYIRNRSNY